MMRNIQITFITGLSQKLAIHSPLLILLAHFSFTSNNNNVCKNIMDYRNVDTNPNCWYNPDVGATTEDLIRRNGYPFEEHQYITEDGYINTLFRIPKDSQPVLTQHGFLSLSTLFTCFGNRSLAFYLAEQGFDVWLGNHRGTIYSKGHQNLSTDDSKYWDFSFHEIGYYDVQAKIELISEITKKKIIYIGHSMGSTISLIYASLRKEHAEKHLSGIIAVCPIAYMSSFGGLFSTISPLASSFEWLFRIHGIFALYRNDTSMNDFCCNFPGILVCKLFVFLTSGADPGQLRAEDIPVIFGVGPLTTSVKVINHYAQIINSGGIFRYYNYGRRENLRKYGLSKPPEYNISLINVPVHLFFGLYDTMSHISDVFHLFNKLKTEDKSLTHISTDFKVKFNHIDFLAGKDVEKLFYEPLMELINNKLKPKLN